MGRCPDSHLLRELWLAYARRVRDIRTSVWLRYPAVARLSGHACCSRVPDGHLADPESQRKRTHRCGGGQANDRASHRGEPQGLETLLGILSGSRGDAPQARADSLLLELGCRAVLAHRCQVLTELAEVSDASGRPDLLARRERIARDTAGPFDFARCQMRVSEYHHDEKIAAHECRVIDCFQAAPCMVSRIVRPAEIPQAMTDLGGQFRFAEGFGQGAITALRVSDPRQGASLHRVKVRGKSSGRNSARSCPGCSREAGSFAESCRIGGLVAHRIEDARAKQPVIASLGERERLKEVPLREGAARRAVVGHPRGEKSRLRGSGEKLATNIVRIPAVQKTACVGVEILDKSLTGVPAAEAVIKLGEEVDCSAEPRHVRCADAGTAPVLAADLLTG